MINEEKLKIVLMKLKEQFDFDVKAVLETVMKMASVRKFLTHEELQELVSQSIMDYMREKAAKTVDEKEFNNDKHQLAGTMAVVISKYDKETIKEAFNEIAKDVELLQSLNLAEPIRDR